MKYVTYYITSYVKIRTNVVMLQFCSKEMYTIETI